MSSRFGYDRRRDAAYWALTRPSQTNLPRDVAKRIIDFAYGRQINYEVAMHRAATAMQRMWRNEPFIALDVGWYFDDELFNIVFQPKSQEIFIPLRNMMHHMMTFGRCYIELFERWTGQHRRFETYSTHCSAWYSNAAPPYVEYSSTADPGLRRLAYNRQVQFFPPGMNPAPDYLCVRSMGDDPNESDSDDETDSTAFLSNAIKPRSFLIRNGHRRWRFAEPWPGAVNLNAFRSIKPQLCCI